MLPSSESQMVEGCMGNISMLTGKIDVQPEYPWFGGYNFKHSFCYKI